MRLLVAMVVLAGCADKPLGEVSIVDQCMRREIFFACLQAVPKGPTRTGDSSDWDEVVQECETSAYRQSVRRESLVKQECRP